MGVSISGDVLRAEQISEDVRGHASDVVSGGIVGDFALSLRTHAFLVRQSTEDLAVITPGLSTER